MSDAQAIQFIKPAQPNVAQFLPPHYACIGKYELDVVSSCNVGCIYCSLKNDGRPQPLAIDHLIDGDYPADLIKKGIYLSPNSDPFSKNARDNTHRILEAFLPKGVNFLITTKTMIPQHTLELMMQYKKQVYAQVSLARLDDNLNKLLEPGAASAANRLATIKTLVDAGFMVTTLFMPLYPHLDDQHERLSSLVQACAAVGNKYIKASYLVINPRDDKAQKMQENELLRKSWDMMTEEIKINIGRGRILPELTRMETYALLTKLCYDNGITFYSCPILDPKVLSNDEATKVCKTYRLYEANVQP